VLKGAAIYGLARLTRLSHAEAVYRAVLMAQGGEFAYVLYSVAFATGLFNTPMHSVATAIVILSMVVTPFALALLRRVSRPPTETMDGIGAADGLAGSMLIIGFGRFGQTVSQTLLAHGRKVSSIDDSVQAIRFAADHGLKVYFGDGSQLGTLHACGAGRADAIAVCVDDRTAATRIAELIKAEFPSVRVLVQAYDRFHTIALARLSSSAGPRFWRRAPPRPTPTRPSRWCGNGMRTGLPCSSPRDSRRGSTCCFGTNRDARAGVFVKRQTEGDECLLRDAFRCGATTNRRHLMDCAPMNYRHRPLRIRHFLKCGAV
jgi:hypothetical protein